MDTSNSQVRKALIDKIRTLLTCSDWTQQEAARFCGQTQPRVSDLLRGNAERFSLVTIAAALEAHSQSQNGVAMKLTEEDGQRLVAEFMAKVAARPIKGTYDLATLGAKTKHGGEVATAIMGIEINGHRIACVGDVVRYPDGTESKIVSGAGAALAYKGKPMAIVGSAVANGDTITSSLQSATQIREYADDTGIPGLLQPAYLAPIQGHA
ncbi:hypothetical protein BV349_05464 [Pseudomonas syringae pv. actinidiae]|nr:hypothetical protein BV349_05464 [Pseudomonas syringae pv. actinidiae]OSN66991.1 hypothetical protein BV351_05485 [Pseudomonas syringae pv. actinidiae]RMS00636.1 hypothetical protein ALP75_200934 [Pseudomonas syringae pv. actinidiae]BBI42225.1 hypothetical protein KPSA1B_100934 [Pseudomonas syringae pv. actinidiae]